MKKTFLILTLSFISINVFCQGNSRKVEEIDSLDITLNKLINSNKSLNDHGISFPNKDKWRLGKIIKLNGDILQGEIKNKKHQGGQTSMVLYFRKDTNSKKQRYRADKLLGFEIADRKYRSKKFANLPPSYIEIIEEGSLNLYYTQFRQVTGHTDYARQIDYVGLHMVYEFYIEISNSSENILIGPISHHQDEFVDLISNYLSDYNELLLKIKSHKYNYWHLREIIQLYNKYKSNV